MQWMPRFRTWHQNVIETTGMSVILTMLSDTIRLRLGLNSCSSLTMVNLAIGLTPLIDLEDQRLQPQLLF
jgi:hypothetical protein